MNKNNINTRRSFLTTTGAAAAIGAAGRRATSANDEIGVGCIGLGVRGGTLNRLVVRNEGVKVVALCDVYQPHIDKGVRQSNNPNVKTYVDYQDLLADKNVDAVVIAAPDHWHAPMLIDAARAGKDVYIEKGWTRTIDEAKAMREAVKKHKIVMQLGHQSRGLASGRQAAELIRDGVIGPVTMVRTGRMENRPVGANFWRWYGWYDNYERPDPKKVIQELDWDRWLGPAEKRPFIEEHFWHWRCYWDYGTGIAGDLLSHEIDFVHAILKHGIPDSCVTMGMNAFNNDGRDVPDTWTSVFNFNHAKRQVTFECSMNTSEQRVTPTFHGKHGVLRFNNIAQAASHFWVYPDAGTNKFAKGFDDGKFKRGEPMLEFDPDKTERPTHMEDFFNCVRSRKKTQCNEDEAFIEAATLVMSVKALREKREVKWDRNKEEVV